MIKDICKSIRHWIEMLAFLFIIYPIAVALIWVLLLIEFILFGSVFDVTDQCLSKSFKQVKDMIDLYNKTLREEFTTDEEPTKEE